MATNYYVMPLAGTGTRSDSFRCKYATNLAPFRWDSMRMGQELTFLVIVRDISGALDTTISGDSTCIAIPTLTNTIGGALATVQSKLETLNIPSGWVTSGMTYATVVHYSAAFFQVHQRLQGLGGARLLTGGVTLDTTFSQLAAGVQTKLLNVATSFNFDTSSLSGASTIRAILKALADQWTRPIYLDGDVL